MFGPARGSSRGYQPHKKLTLYPSVSKAGCRHRKGRLCLPRFGSRDNTHASAGGRSFPIGGWVSHEQHFRHRRRGCLSPRQSRLTTSCYAGLLTDASSDGLRGWMFNGMDSFSVLGASGNPCRAWLDSPTGLADVMEGYCPPHFADMREAVERCASANSAQSLRRRTTLASRLLPSATGEEKSVAVIRLPADGSRR